ncbi:MarR family winged helix-turn-helix transcriptional regulator [Massilia niastensis]|uniref:MarR family winged helix-turn-helix transcriptional regulator n=1 Tax=Massilia niastensis TaxID=544911 RepID=UPI000363FD92|nr:MarR family winged helix-turn-helix transcriptional regulator [Massilia niastensis]
MPTPATPGHDLADLPGHYIRRLQQIAVAAFLQETDGFSITPVQYAALQAVAHSPGIDQRSVARGIGFDTSTIGEVIDRLEKRGLLTRNADPNDRRVRLLTTTAEGDGLLADIAPAVLRVQELILDPLPREERAEFVRMLKQLVFANNSLSRAPTERVRK